MRILIATPYLPWPLSDGGKTAQFRALEALCGDCDFTLVVPVYTAQAEAEAKSLAAQLPNLTVKAVCCSPTLSPRALTRQKIGRLIRRVYPAYSGSSQRGPANPELGYSFNCLHPDYITAIDEEFSKGCDIFQAEFAEMLSLGPFIAGRVPSIFVHHQLHFVYIQRFLAVNRIDDAPARYLKERMLREESLFLNTFSSAIVFSEVDRQALKGTCPRLEVNVSPFPSPEDPPAAALLFDRPIQHFVFVASAGHSPNRDGFCWFMKEVWPIVKSRLPDAIIEVVGEWSPSMQSCLPSHEEIQFSGFVPELGKALRNKIMVVPLWVGSGIRTKILAAWGASCPVVTTSVGVEGLLGQAEEHFVVADDSQTFARECIELSQNINKLNRIAANGVALVKEQYSLEAVRKTRLEIYEKLLADQRQLQS